MDHVNALLVQVQENKYYADSAGTRTVQQRVRIQPEFTAVQVDLAGGRFSARCGRWRRRPAGVGST